MYNLSLCHAEGLCVTVICQCWAEVRSHC